VSLCRLEEKSAVFPKVDVLFCFVSLLKGTAVLQKRSFWFTKP